MQNLRKYSLNKQEFYGSRSTGRDILHRLADASGSARYKSKLIPKEQKIGIKTMLCIKAGYKQCLFLVPNFVQNRSLVFARKSKKHPCLQNCAFL